MRFVLIIHESVCGNPASASKNFLVFAEVLQAPFFPFGSLQKFCKLRFLLFGVCRSSASSDFSFLVFAEVLQTPFFPLGHLQKFCSLLVWRKPKEGSGKNDRVLGDKCIGSNGFASAKKRQSVGIDEDGA